MGFDRATPITIFTREIDILPRRERERERERERVMELPTSPKRSPVDTPRRVVDLGGKVCNPREHAGTW